MSLLLLKFSIYYFSILNYKQCLGSMISSFLKLINIIYKLGSATILSVIASNSKLKFYEMI